jgi:hypothetical protein
VITALIWSAAGFALGFVAADVLKDVKDQRRYDKAWAEIVRLQLHDLEDNLEDNPW